MPVTLFILCYGRCIIKLCDGCVADFWVTVLLLFNGKLVFFNIFLTLVWRLNGSHCSCIKCYVMRRDGCVAFVKCLIEMQYTESVYYGELKLRMVR